MDQPLVRSDLQIWLEKKYLEYRVKTRPQNLWGSTFLLNATFICIFGPISYTGALILRFLQPSPSTLKKFNIFAVIWVAVSGLFFWYTGFSLLLYWLFVLPAAPFCAMLMDGWDYLRSMLMTKSVADRIREKQAKTEEIRKHQERLAMIKAGHEKPPLEQEHIKLGTVVEQSSFLPGRGIEIKAGWCWLSLKKLFGHIFVLGMTGCGKTALLVRIAYEVLFSPEDLDLYIVDAKGSATLARLVCIMAKAAGKGPVPVFRLGWGPGFKSAVFDGFVGDAWAIVDRLIAFLDLERTKTDAEHHHIYKRELLQLVCGLNSSKYGVDIPEPPRSFIELEHRLTYAWLSRVYAGKAIADTIAEWHKDGSIESLRSDVSSSAKPFLHLVAPTGFRLGQRRVILFSIRSHVVTHDSKSFFRFLTKNLQYFMGAEASGLAHKIVLMVDEFGQLDGEEAVRIFELGRELGIGMVAATQSLASLGDIPTTARILDSTNLKITMRCEDAEEIIKRAGTKKTFDPGFQFKEGGTPTGLGTVHENDTFKMDPNIVRDLETGGAFISTNGCVVRLHVSQVTEFSEADFDEATMEDLSVREDILPPEPVTPKVKSEDGPPVRDISDKLPM